MPACIDCGFIDLIGLWTTKSSRLHKPSFLELVFSAENCLSCEIILDSLPTPPVAGLPLPTLLAPSAPLLVVTVNGYKYARTVVDSPINIDSLIFYFDDLWSIQGLDNVQGKADPKYFRSCLDVFSDSPATFDYIVGRSVNPILDPAVVFEWFDECKKHLECSEYSNLSAVHKSDFPSHLIDVNLKEGPIRLVQSKIKGTWKKYLTLSHRWKDNTVKTTQQSLCAHQKRLPLEELSQCFRDAISITKRLGFRYIWIDALCIVQDAPIEMQRECSHMKDIYQNCTIMLTADRAGHSNSGLYPIKQVSKEAVLPFRGASGEQISQFTLSSRRLSTFDSDVIHGMLSPRGWTLQERVLAPRMLHFGKSQLHWECRTSIWNERTDFKRISYTPRMLDDAREMIAAIGRKNLGIPSSRDMVGTGVGSPNIPSGMTLCPPIAALFMGIIRDVFVWGLWNKDLAAGLLWSVHATAPITRLQAPSWSWALIDGELTFYIPSTKWGRPLRGSLETTCDTISLTDLEGPHGTYQSGRFSCRCPVMLVALLASAKIEENEEYPYDHLRQEPNAEVRDVGNKGLVIGTAAMDDDSLVQMSDPLHPLKLHAAMFYRQHSLLANGRIMNGREQVLLSYCILLKPLFEDGIFQRYTLAIPCYVDPEYIYESFTVSSQAELNKAVEGCTSIIGILIIGVNYTGSFSLPFITSISEGIRTEYNYTTGNITDSLTSVDAEHLTSIGYLSLTYSPKLAKISFPNLSNVTSGIELEGIGESASIDFPSLKVAPADLRLSGYIGTINFPILAEVGGTLHVANDNEHSVWNEVDYVHDYKRSYPQSSYPFLDVGFPALQNASSLEIKGNISSINLPQLSVITTDYGKEDMNHGVSISASTHPLNITLPNLSKSSFISLSGEIGNFSFPKLLSTGSLKVDASVPLSVNIAPLVTTDTLTLSGNITELSLSSLEHVGEVNINSDAVLDCSPIIAIWEGDHHSIPDDKFTCAGKKVSLKKTFPKAALVAISVVIPLLIIITLVLLYIQKRKKAIRSRDAAPPPEYDIALEALPKYSPREDGGSVNDSPREDGGSVNGPGSVQGSESVASTQPLERRNGV
ncbi:hypothetical protein VE04_05537 [Pseudogymnoascus sp. 24MN13]|nr:hypothetical protein VE04_05537 [Pseudogymnoascus sp. 24MN13]